MAKSRSRGEGSRKKRESAGSGEVLRRERRASKKTAEVKAGDKKRAKKKRGGGLRARWQGRWQKFKEKRAKRKAERVQPHRSFRRTYREDYVRKLEIPGMMAHLFAALKAVFKNWKLFLPLLILAVVANIVLVGLMSEDTYTQFQEVLDTTNEEIAGEPLGQVAKGAMLLTSSVLSGGLSGEATESSIVFMVIIFLILWLTTIYLLRQRMAGRKVKLRDGLYNAMTPLISTLIVFLVAMVQCVPILIFVIALSAAIQTDFLATPLYALAFFIFAALMIILSAYLLSSSLMALVAVSAPGLYPMKALTTASDLMMGRRIRFILRLVSLIIAVAVVWVVVMLPIVLLDLTLKQNISWLEGVPIVPFCLNVMTCFTIIYVTAYLYIYYRWMLGYKED